MRLRYSLLALLLLTALTGCGEKSAERAAVHGSVTFRGEPVKDGTILFSPISRAKGEPTSPATGKIVDGKYALRMNEGPLVGSHRVEIQSYRKTGKKVPDLMGDVTKPNRSLVDEVVPSLPAKYNIESTLTADIEPGDNTKDFDL